MGDPLIQEPAKGPNLLRLNLGTVLACSEVDDDLRQLLPCRTNSLARFSCRMAVGPGYLLAGGGIVRSSS